MVLWLDDAPLDLAAALAADPRPDPDHLAYVIYTSGTTGTPKGVGVTHRQVFGVLTGYRRVRLLEGLEPTRVRTAIFGLFAAVALVLSTLGIFGVMAYSVTQRRRELGIRLALGAPRRSVVALVLRQGAVLTAAGVILGLALAAVLARSYAQLFAELLAGVDVVDLPTFALVSLGLAAVALAASFLPAHRASRVDPATILHQE